MTGLVSISFRGYTPEEIVAYAVRAGLSAIEWGGDVHVPHGDVGVARRVRALSEDAGLCMPEYGSYYKIGESDRALFSDALHSADALGVRKIRIWGGDRPSDRYTSDAYAEAVAEARALVREARGFTLVLECHPNCLTDEYHTARRFLTDVGEDGLRMLWQPNQHRPLDYNLDAIRALLPYIEGVHTFSWEREMRYPLLHHRDAWREYVALLGRDMPYMLEFMHDDRIESLCEAADALRAILGREGEGKQL